MSALLGRARAGWMAVTGTGGVAEAVSVIAGMIRCASAIPRPSPASAAGTVSISSSRHSPRTWARGE